MRKEKGERRKGEVRNEKGGKDKEEMTVRVGTLRAASAWFAVVGRSCGERQWKLGL